MSFRSVVIDECLQKAPDRSLLGFAYFYCTRDPTEPYRADPSEILRCVARQLSSPNFNIPVHEATVAAYRKEKDEGFALKKLNLRDTVYLILDLTTERPATIIIDGLDECDPNRQHELFEALNNIIRNSANVVNILVTSRDDADIVCHLKGCPNIYIDVQDNAEDIERFIRVEIERANSQKKLLQGHMSSTLKNMMIQTLTEGA